MSQDGGPRIIAKYVEGVRVALDVSADPRYTFVGTGSGGTNHTGWTITDTTQGTLTWRGFIDLSGYRPDDMVIVPQAVQVQYGSVWGGNGATAGTAGGPMLIQMAVTTDKIDDLDFGAALAFEPLAGYIGDNTDMSQVVYGCSEAWGPAANTVNYVNQQRHVYGDGPPIVGPRIYIAIRVQLGAPIVSGSVTDGTFFIPAMRFVIAGEATNIPEYQLLHLMARQYDLQQTPDVDV